MLNEENEKLSKLTPERRKNERRQSQQVTDIKEFCASSIKNRSNGIGEFLILAGFLVPWFMGIVLASGGWLKTLAIFFFPYAWYLVTEKLMFLNGLL